VPNELRIVIADDHPVVRGGLRQVIESEPGFHIVAEATNGEEALAQIQTYRPDIAVLDIDMPKLDGFGVARQMQLYRLNTGVVFLTIHSEEDLLHAAMDLGAKGYVLKESALIEIVSGIRAVASGHLYVSPSLTRFLIQRQERERELERTQTGLTSLTPTERHILSAVAANKSSKQIADELCIHFRTVENHRTNICQKLGINGSNALLKFALQHRSEL
jgi:DNA-binding NarL/FixJ family response regulator